ncbi:hypothetical protein PEDI_48860 [Persicobacter diffluens]|uniref:Sulfatase N-terminal domain-containing protein n=2 Tax=Persicobacter diffluens TaxID=981 RepID=A0AAN4W211_9BACT|nr:hypothetical protein PEDI_48860 [Persicobacter diffluens]
MGYSQSGKDQRPNIVLIQLDDLGIDDLPSEGNMTVKAPNIDRLAMESIRFSQFYVTPVCASSRAELLTGKPHLSVGVSHVHGGKDYLNLEEQTIADVLQEKGYRTAMWGKWHLGKTPGYMPWDRGFEEAFMARLYEYIDKDGQNHGHFNGKAISHEGWVTQTITDYAIQYMHRDDPRPFFAYLPYLTVHEPLKAPEKYKNIYKEKGLSNGLSTLYGMITHLDTHIGRLLDEIQSLPQNRPTYVLFMSDNGPAIIHRYLSEEDRKYRYHHQYRGHKGNILENGIKSPFYFHGFGAGYSDKFISGQDIFAMIQDLSERRIQNQSDLIDFASDCSEEHLFYAHRAWQPSQEAWSTLGKFNEYITLKSSNVHRLYDFKEQAIAYRKGPYKLIQNGSEQEFEEKGSTLRLFNVQEDPQERHNLVQLNPELTQLMLEQSRVAFNQLHVETSLTHPIIHQPSKGQLFLPAVNSIPETGEIKKAFDYLVGKGKAEIKFEVADPLIQLEDYKIKGSENIHLQANMKTEENAGKLTHWLHIKINADHGKEWRLTNICFSSASSLEQNQQP